eukprot:CAMPEP_0183291564 /NCGR_PEP_ID=MMETSP0160_2-20130417/933_1 /TAXON_ID=2839 ORGANISM="Odontella Sinensis, Strain Grunow 1884" /NCGR_SAMPLE_ID=MMETSP0160_2 /ASSEMBLY_ACC=CAM_ASM_000250 /LENGTH=129 /DNA_ID=CAMNT_0025452387 /DNA_START=213 /DNA_END=602 /DNA_ORIENTATION=+
MRAVSVLLSLLFAAVASAFAPNGAAPSFVRSTSRTELFDVKTGVVKWFNTEKGFGFIVPDEGGSDIFVHQTAIKKDGFRSLADGEPVQYELEVDANTGKSKAIDVTGPGGKDVQGAPFPRNSYEDDDFY